MNSLAKSGMSVSESLKLLKCKTKDLIESSIVELLTPQGSDRLKNDIEQELEESLKTTLAKISEFLSSLLFVKMNHLSQLSVSWDQGELSREVVPLIKSLIGKNLLDILKNRVSRQFTETYVSELILEMLRLCYSKMSQTPEEFLGLRCSLQNLLIRSYLETYRVSIAEERGPRDPVSLFRCNTLDDDNIRILSLAYRLVNSYSMEDIDTFLYLFTGYQFDEETPCNLINRILKVNGGDGEKEKAIIELIEDARKRRRIQYGIVEGRIDSIKLLIRETIKTFHKLYPFNSSSKLKREWGKFCESVVWAILLKYEVLFCFNVHLEPSVIGHENISTEVDSIALLRNVDKFLFIDVTFGQDLRDKVSKCCRLIERLRERDVRAVIWIIRSMHTEFGGSQLNDLEIITLSDFAKRCEAL